VTSSVRPASWHPTWSSSMTAQKLQNCSHVQSYGHGREMLIRPGAEVGRAGSVRTMLFRMASAQFVLMSGTIPSRCAMNSSESTDVFAKICTRSMASKPDTKTCKPNGTSAGRFADAPTVGKSAITTRRIELASLETRV
jgi:hypothetical protein